MTMPGQYQRTILRIADIHSMLAAARLAAQAYTDDEYRNGFLAALDVIATAAGVEMLPVRKPAITADWCYIDADFEPQNGMRP